MVIERCLIQSMWKINRKFVGCPFPVEIGTSQENDRRTRAKLATVLINIEASNPINHMTAHGCFLSESTSHIVSSFLYFGVGKNCRCFAILNKGA